MAVDVWAEISSAGVISPRISFSHDLAQSPEPDPEAHRRRSDCCLLNSDFDFFVGDFRGEFPSADELFSDGRILPVQIKKYAVPIPPPPSAREAGGNDSSPQLDSVRKKLLTSLVGEHKEYKPPLPPPAGSRSFWQFKRSNSVNCDESESRCRSKGGLIRSLHFLSRSNSTGSAPNPHKNKPKEENAGQLRKQRSVPNRKLPSPLMPTSAAAPSFHYPYYNPAGQQQGKSKFLALRKCGSHGSNSGGIRISPVLNIPPPGFIGRGVPVNFWGLSSLFCNGKVDKIKKKNQSYHFF